MNGDNTHHVSRKYSRRAFEIVPVTERNRSMKNLINDMLLHIKAFDGDIFGGVVRDYRIGGTIYVRNINCRIDSLLLQVFIQSLQLYFNVHEISVDFDNNFAGLVKHIKVSHKVEDDDSILYTTETGSNRSYYVYIDIVVMSRVEWMKLPCDFDVNILAENTHSLFIRVPYICLNKYTDRINYVMDRIKSNTFCCLESSYMKTPEHVKTHIDKACKLVLRGWIMDDNLLGDATWVVGTWQIMSNGLRMVRRGYDKNEYDKMVCAKECSICNEEFKKQDIVINTKCNHNFHWHEPFPGRTFNGKTESSSNVVACCKGLKEWVCRGNITCPICRQVMF